MNQKEKLFFDQLKDIFIGAKIEGESGFINLMRIKSAYFDVIFKELNKEIEEETKDFPDFKEEMFDKLYTFFKTYFSESGSIYFTYTPLKSKVYERIYSPNKDVILFWKTHMLYYVKTDRLWNNLTIDFDEDGVRYKINFDVSILQHKKANEKREIIYELKEIKDREITFNVLYSERGRKTKIDEILRAFKKRNIHLDEERLLKLFRTYEKQNEVDYFINKNAEQFLKEQFDLWLKNYLFDDESDFSEKRLRQLKVLKETAYKVIDFVAQFEDELVKIWNKPKFVLNINYVITLDRIAKKDGGIEFIEKIVKHKGFEEQKEEWKDLGILDEFDESKLFINTLNGKELSNEYQFLPIDTKYFDEDTKLELLSLFDDLDNELDGWLIHSENYQALKTVLPKFREKVQTIYIDPPFNKEQDADYFYSVKYKDATWITSLENRLHLARDVLKDTGSIFVRCDYNGNMYVRLLMNEIFGEENFRNEIVINRFQKASKGFTNTTESLFFYSATENSKTNFLKRPRVCIYCKQPVQLRWTWAHSAGENKEPRYFIVDGKKVLLYPPKGRHWTNSQEEIDKLQAEGRIRINKNTSYIDTQGNRINFIPEKLQSEDINIDNNWTDIPGYEFGVFSPWKFQTENSEILLKRVIESTSNEGDLVMDFFLGSGTTTAVAHKLGRKWLGVEMGEHFYTVVLLRMKKVSAYDKSGISKEKDVKEHYNQNKAGGFFKYYDLEQYEQTLRKAIYKPSHPFVDFDDKSIYQQYVFMKDLKLLDAMKLDYEKNQIKINFEEIYPNIDLAETLSNLTGKAIKKIEKNAVIFEDRSKIDFDNIDFNLIKPLIWW
ncbi:MAG: site-specific DNA-methyltransferase [Methanophagales archaeon]|nr:site-specific DNA-methyltransferase [Methanophagales archaeon]